MKGVNSMINTQQIRAKDLKVNDYVVVELMHLNYAKISNEYFIPQELIEYTTLEIKAIMELPNGALGMEVLGLDSQPGYLQAAKDDLIYLVVNHSIKESVKDL